MNQSIKEWDAIIIGSGQGGTPLAKKLANAGHRTVLIEKRWVGGTCINDGCTPTKTMIADGELAYTVRGASARGIRTQEVTLDFAKIMQRKNEIVSSFRGSSEKGLHETANLTLIKGEASFSGTKTITVLAPDGSREQHTAEWIFINTGCTSAIPSIKGLDSVPYLTSTSLLDISAPPAHLLIFGGSYIALELGQLFKRLGSAVSVIERGNAILSREDPDIQAAVHQILLEEGIRIYTHAQIDQVYSSEQDVVHVDLIHDKGKDTLTGSHLLLATGRVPQTAALHADKAGIQLDDKGFVVVDEYLQTNVPGIYALGDVKGGPAFTHISYNDYVVLYKNLLEHKKESIKGRPVPYCVFIDPPLGRMGLTEQEARKQGLAIKVAVLPMTRVARALETDHTKGMIKAIVAEGTGLLLGAAVLGDSGGEIMTILQMAMTGGITATQIRDMIFAHPLYAESLNNLFGTLDA